MKSEQQKGYSLADIITQRSAPLNLVKSTITGGPIIVGIPVLLCVSIPPFSSTKLLIALGVEVAAIVWAIWLYMWWASKAPVEPKNSFETQKWTYFSTMVYHMARAMTFSPTSLGMLITNLLIFSYLQIGLVQVFFIAGYVIVALTLYLKRCWLLRVSVIGIQSDIWKTSQSCLLPIGLGVAGLGSMIGTIISRLIPESVGLGIVSLGFTILVIMFLYYGFQEYLIFKTFLDRDV